MVLPVAAGDAATVAFGLNPFGIHFGGTGAGGHGLDGHPGWDVEFWVGASVRAAADGTVQSVLSDSSAPGKFTVQVQHRDSAGTYRTVCTNVESVPAGIRTDALVTRGQVLGIAGNQTSTIGTTTLTYAMVHFQVDDFSRNVGITNPSAVNPETFLDPAGRDAFDTIWRGAAYNVEITEPLTGNTRDVVFPLTRTWARESGDLAARIDFIRRDASGNVHTYVQFDAGGGVAERGSVTFTPVPAGTSTIDLQADSGSLRRGVADIVGDTMRLNLGIAGASRPSTLSGASVYRTQ